MAQTRSSNTFTLANGNRVTVTTGFNRGGSYKTVTVKRRDGTSESRTFRRGNVATHYLGPYNASVPGWASGENTRAAPTARSTRASVAAFAVLVLIVLGVWAVKSITRTAYQDGRNWALRWEAGPLGPEPWVGCNRTDMVSSGYVQTPQAGIFSKRVYGAGEPHDNYARWRAGCLSTKGYYLSQLKSGG